MSSKTVYFAYGSNLWLDQMGRRCPESKFIGIASLNDWKWIINIRGCATIIPSAGDIVYGFLFELSAQDVLNLNGFEGNMYERQTIPVEPVNKKESPPKDSVDSLVYVDIERKSESQPRKEYIYRMNMAIADGLREGIPSDYMDKYLRTFIPPSENEDFSDVTIKK
ncbi:hypothetical protein M413DRAFT_447212 [Hebeloma cylindrosporum]|uniref:gamma-glutamylcyclotransferase n=1 Tax=Hebeloma cylindrosporum TaxID=76867 RepID=A0A0C3C6R2_HEBCY|nr:hypothetical protein M413DRAFT_447212 [Hebeloma cylindrosporum h7]